jgi:transcription elongation factor Elf1
MHVTSTHERVTFIRKVFGEVSRARDGINVAVSCPACNNRQKKKFSINIETGQCHCWVCDLRGKTLIPILRKFDMSRFVDEYCQKFSVELNQKISKENVEKEEEASLPADFRLLVDSSNARDPDIRACQLYLKNRNVTERDLWYYKIGTSQLKRFRRRVIFPSFDSLGDINFFVARGIDNSSRIKYINCPVNKQSIVFNEINIDWKKELSIVEGPFDLLKSGYNSTCLLGSRLSRESMLFSKIAHHKTPVLLCLDSDMNKKSHSIARLLAEYGCSVRILDLGEYSDVGEMTKEDFIKKKKEAPIWSRNSFILNKIRSIESGSLV